MLQPFEWPASVLGTVFLDLPNVIEHLATAAILPANPTRQRQQLPMRGSIGAESESGAIHSRD